MDPNANLLEQERLLTAGHRRDPRLWELRDALRQWLDRGGFAPDWSKAPHARLYWRRGYREHGA